MKTYYLTACLLAFFVSASLGAPESAADTPLVEWFAKPADQPSAIPEAVLTTTLGSAGDLEKARKTVWNAYCEGAIRLGWDKEIPSELGDIDTRQKDGKINSKVAEIGDKKMPYVVLAKGEKPEGDGPVFFCLHGGGGNEQAEGPHIWPVNTQEWFAQMQFTTKLCDGRPLGWLLRDGCRRTG